MINISGFLLDRIYSAEKSSANTGESIAIKSIGCNASAMVIRKKHHK